MRLLALVVTYFPSSNLVENISVLLSQVDDVLVVDNGTFGVASGYIDAVSALSPNVSIHRFPTNRGIATALNWGLHYAISAGYDWLITFDQDSQVNSGMISEIERIYNLYPEQEKVAIMAPVSVDVRLGDETHHADLAYTKGAGLWREVMFTITSGSMMKLSAVEKVGCFDDALFIDGVDFDYCLRVNMAGMRVIEVPSARLVHSLGERTRHRFLWKKVTASNHSAIRRYYIARNRILIARRYSSIYPRLMFKIVLGIFNHMVKILFFERGARKKLIYSFKGIWHGVIGKTGPLEMIR